MSLTGITNISSYVQSLLGSLGSSSSTSAKNNSSIDPASLLMPQDGTPTLSPFAQVLNSLQKLQQANPAEYQQVTSQIATNLQNAAKTATSDGKTSLATELNQLATDFSNASQNNTLPNVQDLAKAMGSHGHHHHHVESSSDSTNSTDGTTSSTTSSTSGSSTDLSQLISSFLLGGSSATQNSTLDPMSIITNTLNTAGISLSQ